MIDKQIVSKHRQAVRKLLDKIDELSFVSAHPDPLIKGSPSEVFRTCGKKPCRCATQPDNRHGPYPVIKIYRNGKQRQIALKKSQKEEWQLAKNYQKQIEKFLELKSSCAELEKLVKNFIEYRVKEWPTQ